MKQALITLLAALAVAPAFAGNLNENEWSLERLYDFTDPASKPEGVFTFNDDGTMTAQGDSGQWLLHYTPKASRMQEGSSLAITLQFNKDDIAPDGNSISLRLFDGQGTYYDNSLYNGYSRVEFEKKIGFGIKGENIGDYYTLGKFADSIAVTFTYTVKNGDLVFSYSAPGIDETFSNAETVLEDIDQKLYWSPALYVYNPDTALTVTDITLTPTLVPEPTSATLSLLALAGLAARRRRK